MAVSITCLLNLTQHINETWGNYNLFETVHISEEIDKFSNGSVEGKKKEKKRSV